MFCAIQGAAEAAKEDAKPERKFADAHRFTFLSNANGNLNLLHLVNAFGKSRGLKLW